MRTLLRNTLLSLAAILAAALLVAARPAHGAQGRHRAQRRAYAPARESRRPLCADGIAGVPRSAWCTCPRQRAPASRSRSCSRSTARAAPAASWRPTRASTSLSDRRASWPCPERRRPHRRFGAQPTATQRPADVGFVAELLDARTRVCVDPARIYATGVSNGGGFAARHGLRAQLAAGGDRPRRGRLPQARHATATVRWVLEIHGTADNVVPYKGSRPTTRAASRVSSRSGAASTAVPANLSSTATGPPPRSTCGRPVPMERRSSTSRSTAAGTPGRATPPMSRRLRRSRPPRPCGRSSGRTRWRPERRRRTSNRHAVAGDAAPPRDVAPVLLHPHHGSGAARRRGRRAAMVHQDPAQRARRARPRAGPARSPPRGPCSSSARAPAGRRGRSAWPPWRGSGRDLVLLEPRWACSQRSSGASLAAGSGEPMPASDWCRRTARAELLAGSASSDTSASAATGIARVTRQAARARREPRNGHGGDCDCGRRDARGDGERARPSRRRRGEALQHQR